GTRLLSLAQSQPGLGREVAAGVGRSGGAAGFHPRQSATRGALAGASGARIDRRPSAATGLPLPVEARYRFGAQAVPPRRAGARIRGQGTAPRGERIAPSPRLPLAGGSCRSQRTMNPSGGV